MKKKAGILAAMLCAAIVALALPSAASADTVTYTLRDDFGAAPLCRELSDNMERVELSNAHKPYTKYGYGVHLTSAATGREYVTYDVEGVSAVEISAVVRQSNFGANHGWGLSLGVTDNPTDQPLNNINNIDLNNIFPIYLSAEGRPFIFTQNAWWGYLAAPKYSFAPSNLDVTNMLRQFTVPDEVGGVIDTDGFTVLQAGYRYPMLNLEYQTADGEAQDEWIPMVHDGGHYRITSATFIGGEKEYAVTVQVRNIPAEAKRVRVGTDYIRETLKPSSSGDTEADVYEAFPIAADEGIYVTGVKLTLTQAYEGGFEQLDQTGIAVDYADARRTFGFGETYSAEGLRYYDVYGEGVREESFDVDSFALDASAFRPYVAGIYSITVTKQDYDPVSFFVEVMRPGELTLSLDNVTRSVSESAPFSAEGLVVTARTNVGTVSAPVWKECVLPATAYEVDASAIDYTTAGDYTVTVSAGTGNAKASASFTVTVASGTNTGDSGATANSPAKKKCGCGSSAAATALPIGIACIGAGAAVLTRRKKKTNGESGQ